MAKLWWYWRNWIVMPRQASNPSGVLEPLLEGTLNERTRYSFWFIGPKWWRILVNPLNSVKVFVKDPRLLIGTRDSQILTPQGEVMEWLRANVHTGAKVVIDTSQSRNGEWDTNQEDFVWVEFNNPKEATMFKLVFG